MHCREKIFSTFKDYLFLFLRHSTPASAAFIPGTFLTFFYHFSERSASTFFWKKKLHYLSSFFHSFDPHLFIQKSHLSCKIIPVASRLHWLLDLIYIIPTYLLGSTDLPTTKLPLLANLLLARKKTLVYFSIVTLLLRPNFPVESYFFFIIFLIHLTPSLFRFGNSSNLWRKAKESKKRKKKKKKEKEGPKRQKLCENVFFFLVSEGLPIICQGKSVA